MSTPKFTVTELPTLYDDLKAAGVPLDSHESDLYCRATPEAERIMAKHHATGRVFVSQTDGQVWIDLPFQFKPFWDAVAERGKR